jgi:hypothetical protein
MNPTARSSRLVSGIAVAAVCIAAVAAMWAEGGRPLAERTLAATPERPAADAPVRVVKGPPLADLRRQPASCGDCLAPRLRENSL